jgi:hypothetical protein
MTNIKTPEDKGYFFLTFYFCLVVANFRIFHLMTQNYMNVLLAKNPTLYEVLNHPDMMKELKGDNMKLIN